VSGRAGVVGGMGGRGGGRCREIYREFSDRLRDDSSLTNVFGFVFHGPLAVHCNNRLSRWNSDALTKLYHLSQVLYFNAYSQ
jgi:hypothetical protein